MGKSNGSVLDIPVEFGAFGCGKTVARLGVKISRSVCNIVAADEFFCGHRLTGKVIMGGSDEMPNQTKLLETGEEVEGTFDVKSVHLAPEHISISLSFGKKEVKGLNLEDFVGCAGRLVINTVAEIPADADDDEDETADQTRSFLSEGPWRDVQLDTLFDGALLKSLHKAGLETVGALSDYTRKDRRLTDLEGVGTGKAQKIEDALLKFWSDNPQYGDGAEA